MAAVALACTLVIFNPKLSYAPPIVEAQEIPVPVPPPVEKTPQQLVQEHFGVNANVMIAVAQCESGQRQFRASSTPLISPTNDVGYAQINIKTWDTTATRLGLDYRNNLEDNIKMAKIVFDQQGFTAWTMYKNGCYRQYL